MSSQVSTRLCLVDMNIFKSSDCIKPSLWNFWNKLLNSASLKFPFFWLLL